LFRKNQNWLCAIVGATGTGKSYTALHLAEVIDPEFTITRVVFTTEEFMKLLNSGTLKRGSCIVWDEAGTGINTRDWYTISNKTLSLVVQTFRNMNIALIMTVPSFAFLDSQIRALFHGYIQTCGVDRNKNEVVVKYYELSQNPMTGKIYMKFPREKLDNGRIAVITTLAIAKPSTPLIDAYETKKIQFTKTLNIDAQKSIVDARIKEEAPPTNQPKDITEIITTIKANPNTYMKTWHGKTFIDYHKIMSEFGVGIHTALKVKAEIGDKPANTSHTAP